MADSHIGVVKALDDPDYTIASSSQRAAIGGRLLLRSFDLRVQQAKPSPLHNRQQHRSRAVWLARWVPTLSKEAQSQVPLGKVNISGLKQLFTRGSVGTVQQADVTCISP